jgi:hypothetical protein
MKEKNKGGFCLLQTKPLTYKDESIGSMTNPELPPIYKLFLQSFFIGDNSIEQQFYLTGSGSKGFCSSFVYKNDSISNELISFEGFTDFDTALNIYLEKETFGYDDEREKGLFVVGYGAGGSGIFVGMLESNRDQIFYLSDSYMYKIADNIFQFVQGIEYVSNFEDTTIMTDVPYNKLYRNWDEDFWRVREE